VLIVFVLEVWRD